MANRERVRAALRGEPVDRAPLTLRREILEATDEWPDKFRACLGA
jgi:hypothetical protein